MRKSLHPFFDVYVHTLTGAQFIFGRFCCFVIIRFFLRSASPRRTDDVLASALSVDEGWTVIFIIHARAHRCHIKILWTMKHEKKERGVRTPYTGEWCAYLLVLFITFHSISPPSLTLRFIYFFLLLLFTVVIFAKSTHRNCHNFQ